MFTSITGSFPHILSVECDSYEGKKKNPISRSKTCCNCLSMTDSKTTIRDFLTINRQCFWFLIPLNLAQNSCCSLTPSQPQASASACYLGELRRHAWQEGEVSVSWGERTARRSSRSSRGRCAASASCQTSCLLAAWGGGGVGGGQTRRP